MALRKITPGENIVLDQPKSHVRKLDPEENITLDHERGVMPARYEAPVYLPKQEPTSDIGSLITSGAMDTARRFYEFSGNVADVAADKANEAKYYLDTQYYNLFGYPEQLDNRPAELTVPKENMVSRGLRAMSESDFQRANVLAGKISSQNAVPSVSWDQVRPGLLRDPDAIGPPRPYNLNYFKDLGVFALEQSAISAPEMALAMLPGGQAMVTATTSQNILENRAQNTGRDIRDVPTNQDLQASVLAGTVSAGLEKIGALGDVPWTLGGRARPASAMRDIPIGAFKSGVGEAVTEGVQENVETTGATLGTGKEPTMRERLDIAASAGLVGFGMGSTIRTGTEGVSALTRGFSETVTEKTDFQPPPPGRDALADKIRQAEETGQTPAQPTTTEGQTYGDTTTTTLKGPFVPNVSTDIIPGDTVEHTDRFGQIITGTVQSVQNVGGERNINITDQAGQPRTIFEREGPVVKLTPVPEVRVPTRDDLAAAINGEAKPDAAPVSEPVVQQPVVPRPAPLPDIGPADMTDMQLEKMLETIKAQGKSQGWNRFFLEQRDALQAEIDRRKAQTIQKEAENVNTEPSDAQKEAGNYQKGHIDVSGLKVSIENPKNSVRKGKDATGKEWQVQMPVHYGYIKRTEGADGDQIDVFVGENPSSEQVFVIDQIDPDTKAYDEHKIMLGFESISDAMTNYARSFSDGRGANRIGSIKPMKMEEFKDWLRNGDTKKPLSYNPPEAPQATENVTSEVTSPQPAPEQRGAENETVAQESGPRRGEVGIRLGAGEQVLTNTGRLTTKFPKLGIGTPRSAKLTEKRVENWLMQNAIDEARARGDEFNLRQFEAAYKKPSQSDKDSAEAYLFDPNFVFENPPSILKPFSTPETKQQTEDVAPQQPETAPEPAENIETKPNTVSEEPNSATASPSDVETTVKAEEVKQDAEASQPEPTVDSTAENSETVAPPPLDVLENQPDQPQQPDNASEISSNEAESYQVSSVDGTTEKLKSALYDAIKGGGKDKTMYVFTPEQAKQIIAELEKKDSDQWGNRLGATVNVSKYYKNPKDGIAFSVQDSVGKNIKISDEVRQYLYPEEVTNNERSQPSEPQESVPDTQKGETLPTLPEEEKSAAAQKPKKLSKKDQGTLRRKMFDLYYKKDRIIKSYGGFDKVIDYTYEPFSVTVVEVQKNGDKWVEAGRIRNHSTQPSLKEIQKVWNDEGSKPSEEETENARTVRQDEIPASLPDSNVTESAAEVPRGAEVRATEENDTGNRDGGRSDVSGDGESSSDGKGSGRRSEASGDRDSVQRDDTVLKPDKKATPANTAKGKNHVIEVGALDEARGQKQKAKDNIKIIKLVKQIESENRPATPEEQTLLAQYTGWGSIKNAFKDGTGQFKEDWKAIAQEVKDLLSDKEYREAERTIQYAHYTSEIVVRSMWDAMKRLGLKTGTVFEPGMGIGHFAGMMPQDINVKYSGLEYDGMSARIARILYPESSVRHTAFEDAKYADNTFDAAIGNPPFQSQGKLKYKKESVSLHNFFFLKTLDMIAPGGIVAFVTSRYSMDTLDPSARKMIAESADLVGAIRLPDTAFKTNAHTDVVTDIIFLRKRLPGEESNGVKWFDTKDTRIQKKDGGFHAVNEYFHDHPEMVLGNYDVGTMHEGSLTVTPIENRDLQEQIQEAIDRLPENIITEVKKAESNNLDFTPPEKKEGSYYIKDGVLMQVDQGVGTPVPLRGKGISGITAAEKAKIEAMIPVRDALRKVMDAMLKRNDEEMGKAQKELTKHYDAFFKKYGPITKSETTSRPATASQIEEARDELRNDFEAAGEEFNEGDIDLSHLIGRINPETNKKFTSAQIAKIRQQKREALEASGNVVNEGDFNRSSVPDNITINYPNLKAFREDPESYNLMILDTYDEETGSSKKGDVFTKNIIAVVKKPEIKTAVDALNYSMVYKNQVDINFMANELGRNKESIINELQELDLIYEVPDFNGGEPIFIHSERYLSGKVKDTLAYAKVLEKNDPKYRRNVMALEAVQPKDIPTEDINTQLGSPYFDKKVIAAFMEEVLKIKARVDFQPLIRQWTVEAYYPYAPENLSQYGTEEKPAHKLVEALLSRSDIKVTRPDPTDDSKRIVDVDATARALDKAKNIQEMFDNWIWKSSFSEEVHRYYNDNFNNVVPRVFSGKHLTTAITPKITLMEHQKNAVWRVLQEGNAYFAHAVGAGKAQPLDAKILTPSGWKTMGEIFVGDYVIAVDGQPTKVIGVYPQGEKEIYKVRFSDGSETECCDEHLWTTWNYEERSAKSRSDSLGKDWPSAKPKVRALSEIRKTLSSSHLGAKNHSIPIVSPVDFDKKPIPLNPYLLGVLLGDGCTRHNVVSISSQDTEIINRCRKVLPDNTEFSKKKTDRCPVWGIKVKESKGYGAQKTKNPVVSALADIGLMEKYANQKHIPEKYKYNTAEIRIELLRGLMDTDGSVSKNGSVYYYTTSDLLADDVVEIVQSLGGIVRRSVKIPQYTHNGEKRKGKPCHILCICLPEDINPFHLKRKKDRVVPKTKYKPVRYITEVVPVGRKKAQCIMVEHKDHLYVTDDFIVTHNTLEMVVTGMEMRRLGLWKKPLYIVPNHMLAQFAGEFKAAYPQANIFVADENNFHTDRRRRFVANVAKGDWDAVIMTFSSFKKIPVSSNFESEMIIRELDKYREAWYAAGGKKGKKAQRGSTAARLQKQIEKMEERLKSLKDKGKDQSFTFEELGVDAVLADEAHEFRKLSFQTNQGTMKGVNPVGSKAAWDLYIKTRYLDTINPGRNLVLASGTPLTNTLAEIFTIQRFLNERGMVERGIDTFDAWSSVYASAVSGAERQPSGKYKTVTRLASFKNLASLSQMVREFMDVVTSEELGTLVNRPTMKTGTMIIRTTKPTTEYLAFEKYLDARIEEVSKKRGNEKGSDNMLAIIGEGRMAAIDMRMIDPTLPENDSKLEDMIDNVIQVWKNTSEDDFRVKYSNDDRISPVKGGTQLIFSDLGVSPKTKNGKTFSVYQHIRRKLIKSGIPESQIAFISDYESFEEKRRLQAMVNGGEIRILIGSTEKMGTGLNVQNRLKAIHNLDAPWIPADLEQRIGRGYRQGNQYKEIEVYAYGTEASYDTTLWGLLERKASFINQFLKGGVDLKEMSDIEETDYYAVAKAMTSGDPRVLKQHELKKEVENLSRKRRNFTTEQREIEHSITRKKQTIESETQLIKNIDAIDKKIVRPKEDEFKMIVRGKPYTERSEAAEALSDAIEAVKAMGRETSADGIKIAEYYGLDVNVFASINRHLKMEYSLYFVDPAMSAETKSWTEKEPFSGSGAITSLTNMIHRLPTRKENAKNYITRAEREIKVFESNRQESFPKEQEYKDKVQELEELEKDLHANAPAEIVYDEYPIDYWRRNKLEMSSQFSILSDEEYSYLYENPENKKKKKKSDKIAKDIEEDLKKLNFPKANIRFYDPDTSTKSLDTDRTIGGYFDRKTGLIHISLEAKDYIAVLRHEVIHALKKAGAFTDAEWKLLKEKAPIWREKYGIDKKYRKVYKDELEAKNNALPKPFSQQEVDNLLEDYLIEEAIAYAFQNYNEKGFMERLRKRIIRFFSAIKALLTGKPYEFKTADEVFAAVSSGEIAEREIVEKKLSSLLEKTKSKETLDDLSNTLSDKYGMSVAMGRNKEGIVISSFKVPEEDRGQGSGTKAIRAIIEYADRSGEDLFITPTKDAAFYRKFGFTDNPGGSESMVYRPDVMYSILPDKKEAALEKAKTDLSGVRGIDNELRPSISKIASYLLHPHQIASLYSAFTPVYRMAIEMMKFRDVLVSHLSTDTKLYNRINYKSKDKINAVLEIGRLTEKTFTQNEDGRIRVKNVSHANAVHSKIGEEIVLEPPEARAYLGVRKAMDKALDTYIRVVLEEFDLIGKGIENSSDLSKALAHETDEAQIRLMTEALQIIYDIEFAKKSGYIPFKRWGEIGITVRETRGEEKLVHFERVEIPTSSLKGRKKNIADNKSVQEALKKLVEKYPEGTFSINVFEVKDFTDVSAKLNLNELDVLAMSSDMSAEDYQSMREMLSDALQRRSFRKHFYKSGDVSGYSGDFERAINDYIISISGHLARRKYNRKLEKSIQNIGDAGQKSLFEYARDYVNYITDPREEFAAIRQMAFIWYLAGNIASGVTNALQPFMVTAPWFKGAFSHTQIAMQMSKAYKDSLSMMTVGSGLDVFDFDKAPDDVKEALKRAAAEGDFIPLETWDAMGGSRRHSTHLRALGRASRATMDAISLTFSVPERMNRIVTYISAYRFAIKPENREKIMAFVGRDQIARQTIAGKTGENFAEAFADYAVFSTQYRMGKLNRPSLARRVGTLPFQFMSYSLQTLELMYRLGRVHGGKKATSLGIMLLSVVVMAGMKGIPFEDDLEDLFETLWKNVNRTDFDVETEIRKKLSQMFGKTATVAIVKGLPSAFLDVDMSTRLGFGNLLPNDQPDLLGVWYDMLYTKPVQASVEAARGDYAQAAATLSPTAVKNLIQSQIWAFQGIQSSATGDTIIPPEKITDLDVALKAFGFTSSKVSEERSRIYAEQRLSRAANDLRSDYYDRLARAFAGKIRAGKVKNKALVTSYADEIRGIFDEIEEYNSRSADYLKIIPNERSLKQRIHEELKGSSANKPRKQARQEAESLKKAYGVEEEDGP